MTRVNELALIDDEELESVKGPWAAARSPNTTQYTNLDHKRQVQNYAKHEQIVHKKLKHDTINLVKWDLKRMGDEIAR